MPTAAGTRPVARGTACGLLAALAWAAAVAAPAAGQAPGGNAARTGIGKAAWSRFDRGEPRWLSLSGEFRVRFESRRNLGYVEGADDDYGLVRTRVNVGVKPASWLQFGFQGQDARAPGIRESLGRNGAFRDGFDVRQAYVAFSGGAMSAVKLTVGRQLLLYGDQRLLGPLDWLNTARAFDAIKLELRAGPAKLDFFSASVVRNDPLRRINRPAAGNNLHGSYGTLPNVLPKSTLEPYVLWQTNPSTVDELGQRGDMDRFTAGLRIWGKGLGPWDYNIAVANQSGRLGAAGIQAWGGYAEAGYTLDHPRRPRFYAQYTIGSGDSDPNDGVVGGFVDVYPTAHAFYGYNDLVGWRNIQNLRLGAEFSGHGKLRLRLDYHSFRLLDANDGLYQVAGRLSVPAPTGGAEDKDVGDEINVTVQAPLTPILSLAGGVGHFFPGPFVEANSPGHGHTFSYLGLSYKF